MTFTASGILQALSDLSKSISVPFFIMGPDLVGSESTKGCRLAHAASQHDQHDCLLSAEELCGKPYLHACRPVQPVFWSANYVTLAPCEEVAVTVEARVPAECLLKGVVSCKGWNTQAAMVRLRHMSMHADQSLLDNPASSCALLRQVEAVTPHLTV